MDTSLYQDLQLRKILRKSGSSLTTARRKVFKTLTAGPTTNARLGDILEGQVDRASVYRVIKLYEDIGIVRRIWNGFKSQIELSEAFVPHHHHARCRQCGRHIAVNSSALEEAISAAAEALDFTIEDHHIELIGSCNRCKEQAS